MTSGIYGIKNIITGKYYIGCSKHCKRRWYEHRYNLKKGTHHSLKLQRSYDKHGPEAFVFEIIKEINDLNTLQDVEEEFIELYKSWSNGYNSLKRGAKLYDYEEGSRRNYKKPEYSRGTRPICFYITDAECYLLVDYCTKTGRTKTDVLREFIRSLKEKL